MTTTTKPPPDHGTYERARGGDRSGAQRCHCRPCRTAEGSYRKRRCYLTSTGRPLLVDAAPVRDHLHHLHAAGDAYTHIADLIGVCASTVDAIAIGRRLRVRAGTAAAILALAPGTAAARNRSVPALGSTRRIRALLALGHQLAAVVTAARIDLGTASYLLNGHVDTIDDPAAFPDWTGQCGTAAGYSAHSRHHVPYCDPCRRAWTAHKHTRTAAAAPRR